MMACNRFFAIGIAPAVMALVACRPTLSVTGYPAEVARDRHPQPAALDSVEWNFTRDPERVTGAD